MNHANKFLKKLVIVQLKMLKILYFISSKTYYTTQSILAYHIRYRKPDMTYNSNQKFNKYAYK